MVYPGPLYSTGWTTKLPAVEDKNKGRFKPLFTKSQNEETVKHLKNIEKMFFGMSSTDVRRLTCQYAEVNKIQHPICNVKENGRC